MQEEDQQITSAHCDPSHPTCTRRRPLSVPTLDVQSAPLHLGHQDQELLHDPEGVSEEPEELEESAVAAPVAAAQN